MKYNIAETVKYRYQSRDFRNEYLSVLGETFANNKGDIVNKIIDLFNVSNYETQKELSNWKVITRDQANKIYEFVSEDIESFIDNYGGYYVGYTSLESVEFGEQEEPLTGLYNHKTGKPYSLPYLRKIFDAAGYVINNSSPEYAYYIVSGGLHIDLLKGKDILNDFVATI